MLEDIKKILDYAVWAPSGDNSQPWRFEVEGNKINIFNIPERDTSLYNHEQNASLVALGCLLENIKISASYSGYKSKIAFFPSRNNSNHIAAVSLDKMSGPTDALYPYIKVRASNRKPYSRTPLSASQKEQLLAEIKTIGGARLKIVDGEKSIENIARAASVNEKVVLENRELHHFLFEHITWNEEEDKIRAGFFIKTFELKGPQLVAFKLFRRRFILSVLNKIGISKMVARENEKTYSQSAAFGAVLIPAVSQENWVRGGMVLQRVWLKATALGLGVQPLAGICFLMHRINGRGGKLTEEHQQLVRNAYQTFQTAFETKDQIAIIIRIGKADAPTARTRRLPVDMKIINYNV